MCLDACGRERDRTRGRERDTCGHHKARKTRRVARTDRARAREQEREGRKERKKEGKRDSEEERKKKGERGRNTGRGTEIER